MPLTQEQRQKAVEVAESWLNTKYHPNAGVKGVGVDCCQFLVKVYHEAGLVPDIDLGSYSTTAHFHQKIGAYEAKIREYADQIAEEEVQPGDMVLYKIAHDFAHGAVVKEWPGTIIHAVNEAGVVYSHAAKERFIRSRPRMFFTLK